MLWRYLTKAIVSLSILLLFIIVFERNQAIKMTTSYMEVVDSLKRENLKLERELHRKSLTIKLLRREKNEMEELISSLSVYPIIGHEIVICSDFGVDRGTHIHMGIDIPVIEGTPILAPANGRVTSGYSKNAGNIAILETTGVRHRFFHLKDLPIEGEVSQGDIIALSGNTGRSSGPHIHYEVQVLRDGQWLHVDPKYLIRINEKSLPYKRIVKMRDEEYFN